MSHRRGCLRSVKQRWVPGRRLELFPRRATNQQSRSPAESFGNTSCLTLLAGEFGRQQVGRTVWRPLSIQAGRGVHPRGTVSGTRRSGLVRERPTRIKNPHFNISTNGFVSRMDGPFGRSPRGFRRIFRNDWKACEKPSASSRCQISCPCDGMARTTIPDRRSVLCGRRRPARRARTCCSALDAHQFSENRPNSRGSARTGPPFRSSRRSEERCRTTGFDTVGGRPWRSAP